MRMLVQMIWKKNHNRRPWPETMILIEVDSACRNQQGNCDEVENSARPFLLFFSTLWLNLCNNSDQTLFSNALTFASSLGSFNISLGSWQTLMHGKPCLIL